MINLLEIKEMETYYSDPANFGLKNISREDLQVRMHVNYSWDMDQDRFGVHHEVLYDLHSGEEIHTCFRLKILFLFSVTGLCEFLAVHGPNDFSLDRQLELNFLSISTSAMRGVAHEKLRGTPLSGHILPLVRPEDLLVGGGLG